MSAYVVRSTSCLFTTASMLRRSDSTSRCPQKRNVQQCCRTEHPAAVAPGTKAFPVRKRGRDRSRDASVSGAVRLLHSAIPFPIAPEDFAFCFVIRSRSRRASSSRFLSKVISFTACLPRRGFCSKAHQLRRPTFQAGVSRACWYPCSPPQSARRPSSPKGQPTL